LTGAKEQIKNAVAKQKEEAPEEKKSSYKAKELEGKPVKRSGKLLLSASSMGRRLEAETEEELKKALEERMERQINVARRYGHDVEKETKRLQEEHEDYMKWARPNFQHVDANREFEENIKKNVPKGVRVSRDDNDQVTMSFKTKNGTPIKVEFSMKNGFSFSVAGQYGIEDKYGYNRDLIKDKREQIEVGMRVRSLYDAVVRSIPEGTVIKTNAWPGDNKYDSRVRAYQRVGFSAPETKAGEMYAVKGPNNTMSPGTKSGFETQESGTGMWFAEKADDKEAITQSVKDWFTIITGETL
jgi:hypothetical protein